MKKLISLVCIVLMAGIKVDAQSFVCKDGKAHFYSSAKMENIEATNNGLICILTPAGKKVQVKIPNKSFIFPNPLMQEHFNENYIESDKYEYSSLDGVIQENIDFTKDGTYDVTVKGTLEIHGVAIDRDIKAQLVIKGGVPVKATAKFKVKIEDYKIKVPTIMTQHIAEIVDVDVAFVLQKN